MQLKKFLRPLIGYYIVLDVVEPIATEGRHVQLKMPFAIHVERRVISLQFPLKMQKVSPPLVHTTLLCLQNTSDVKFP